MHTLGQALQSRESLSSVSLLDTDVNIVLLGPNLLCGVERISLVSEGVYQGGTCSVSRCWESMRCGEEYRKGLDANQK